jgi:hypothetical protein
MKAPRIRVFVLVVALIILASHQGRAQESSAEGEPGPYVNVYHDDAVAFQVRRDRITVLGEGLYKVWLRWLWAEPKPWKSGVETATVIFSDLDCARLCIRELAVLHKDRDGKIFDEEERSPEESPWKSFGPQTGAGLAIAKLCKFVPELARAARTQEQKKE